MNYPNIPLDTSHPMFAREVNTTIQHLHKNLLMVQDKLEQAQAVNEKIIAEMLSSQAEEENVNKISNSNVNMLAGKLLEVQYPYLEYYATLPSLSAQPDALISQDKALIRVGTKLYVTDYSTNPATLVRLLPNSDIFPVAITSNVTGGVELKAINTTEVVVSTSTTSDQNLMKYSMAAGLMNTVGKCLRVTCSGLYDVDTAANITWKVKVGSTTVLSWTPQTPAGVKTDLPFRIQFELITITTGATGTLECHGIIFPENKITSGHQPVPQLDLNTTPSGAIDLTSALDVQITIAFDTSSTNNKGKQRVMITEFMPS